MTTKAQLCGITPMFRRLDFCSIAVRNVWVDVLEGEIHPAVPTLTGPLSQLLVPPSGDPEKQLSAIRSAFFRDNEIEAIGPLRRARR